MGMNVKLGASSTGNFGVKFETPNENLTLKNTKSETLRIDNMLDVDSSMTNADGSMLLYHSETDQYVQTEVFQFSANNEPIINGGEF
jgi:hypothetical protein